MRFLIFGSGAVGSYLGVTLALSGQPVSFLSRPHSLDQIRQRGFTMTGSGPPTTLAQPAVYSDATQAFINENPDVIFLTVKAYDVAEAASTLAPLLNPSQTVVSFLNGINNESTLAQILGESHVLPATLTTAVQAPQPGTIRVERVRGIGLAGGHSRLAAIQETLEHAGLSVRSYTDAGRMKWSKLLTNIVSNASSAILDWTAGQIYRDRRTARLEIEALREAVRVMHAIGLTPTNLPGVRVAILGRAIFLPALLTRSLLGRIVGSGRGAKKPSLHYDIGRERSEISWLNGAVVRYGLETGIPTPINLMLTQTMLDLVHKRRPHQEFINNPQALLDLVSA